MKLCDVKTDFGKPQGYKPCEAGHLDNWAEIEANRLSNDYFQLRFPSRPTFSKSKYKIK